MKTLLNELIFRTPLYAPDEPPAALPTDPPASILEGDEPPADPPKVDDPPADSNDTDPKANPPEGDEPAPLTFEDFNLPEGVDVEDANSVAFLELVNNTKLTPTERAQGLIDLQQTVTQTMTENLTKELQTYWDNNRTTNQEAVRALPGFEGEKLHENLAQIKKGLEAVGATAETFKAFTTTGAGDDPHIVQVLFELTKRQKEGGPISGQPDGAKLSQADRMFGTK